MVILGLGFMAVALLWFVYGPIPSLARLSTAIAAIALGFMLVGLSLFLRRTHRRA